MIHNLTVGLAMGALMLAAAPGFADDTTEAEEHGSTVRGNLETQLLNPGGPSHEPGPTSLDGPKAENILKTYRSEQQKAETEGLIEGMGQD